MHRLSWDITWITWLIYIYIYILISKIWGVFTSKVSGWIQRNPNRSGYQGCLEPPCIREEPEYIKGNTLNTFIYRNLNEKGIKHDQTKDINQHDATTFFGVACDMTLWISNVSDNPTGGNQIFLELAILCCVNNVFVDMSVQGGKSMQNGHIHFIYIYTHKWYFT